VLHLLMRGLSNRDIAKALGISKGTVKVHISSLLAKHRVKRRVDLILRHAPMPPDQKSSKKTWTQ
jgi:DNA-binding NarL/FixJ family response regulator